LARTAPDLGYKVVSSKAAWGNGCAEIIANFDGVSSGLYVLYLGA